MSQEEDIQVIEEPPVPLTEDQRLALDIQTTKDESLESTRRMVQMCLEAKECGIKSLVALDDQKEKLESFERGMQDIYEDMVEAEAAMASMGAGCWGLCVPCQERLDKKPDPECFEEYIPPDGGERPEELSTEGVPKFGGFIAKYTNDKDEDEMEQNMQEVSNCIGNLRNMAIDMGGEISRQNDYIEKIQAMCDDNQGRLDRALEQAAKLNAD